VLLTHLEPTSPHPKPARGCLLGPCRIRDPPHQIELFLAESSSSMRKRAQTTRWESYGEGAGESEQNRGCGGSGGSIDRLCSCVL